MIRQSYFLFVILFMSCQSQTERNGIDVRNTALDKLVETSDKSTIKSPSKVSEQIVQELLIKHTTLYRINNNKELIGSELLIISLADTTAKPNIYFRISAYDSKKSAITAFRDQVETEICCIPDEDIMKVKNFNNVESIKNVDSKILYSENILIVMRLGPEIDDNKPFNDLIESYFKGTDFKKLEIGYGGPAVWTKK